MKTKIFLAITAGGLLLLSPLFVFAYSDSVTHPDLTAQAAVLHNYLHPERPVGTRHITEFMTRGSFEEDIMPRFVNHFYDPTTGKGWSGHHARHFATKNFEERAWEAIQRGLSTAYDTIPSPQWVVDREAQAIQYRPFGGDRTWQRALEYALDDNWDQAYLTLGYVLHLMQDASVPAHVRDDSHADGEIYESWTRAHSLDNARNVGVAQAIVNNGTAVPKITSPSDAIKWVAEYTNRNFFSDNTILEGYSNPSIQSFSGDFGYSFVEQEEIPLVYVVRDTTKGTVKYSLDNPVVMSAYWDRLSKRAVLAGAATIELFHEEVERMERTGDRPDPAPGFLVERTKACLQTGPLLALRGNCAQTVVTVPSPRNLPNVSPLAIVGPLKRGWEELARVATRMVSVVTRDNDIVAVQVRGPADPNDGYNKVKVAVATPPQGVDGRQSRATDNRFQESNGFLESDTSNGSDSGNSDTSGLEVPPSEDNNDEQEPSDPFIRVTKVFDGDTIQLATGRVVRYMSIDTPEEPDACFASEATQENKRLVEGKRVRLQENPGEEQDTHGRQLAYVFAEDGTFVNEVLVRRGFATTLLIPPRGSWDGALQNAAKAAKREKLGLWGNACADKTTEIPEPVEGAQSPESGDDDNKDPITVHPDAGSGGGGYRPSEAVKSFGVNLPETILGIADDEDTETEGLQITITGTGVEGTVVAITGDAEGETTADDAKQWSTTVTLAEGENSITFGATVPSTEPVETVSWSGTVDLTVPVAVTDLEAEEGSLTVRWTVPDEDAVSYEVRFQTQETITADNWGTATLAGSVTPDAVAGEQEERTFDTDFGSSATVFVAVRVADTAGNWSGLSNVVELTRDKTADHLVISEIQIAGLSSVKNEFVELHNPTASAITMNGWKMTRRTSGGTEHNLVSSLNGTVPAHGYFLIASDSGFYKNRPYPDVVFSGKSATFIIAPDNTVLLYDDTDTVVDRVAFGAGTDPEGAVFTQNPAGGESIERIPNADATATSLYSGTDRWAGNGWDADNNATDFILQTTPNPQNSGALTEPRNGVPTLTSSPAPLWRLDAARSGFVGSAAGPLFEIASSSVAWSETTESTSLMTQVTTDGTLLYEGDAHAGLRKRRLSDGTVVADRDLSDEISGGAPFIAHAPVVVDDRLYVLVKHSGTATLFALDSSDLATLWHTDLGGDEIGNPFLLEGGDIVIATKNHDIMVVSPNGNVRQTFGSFTTLPSVAWDGEGYVVTTTGNVPAAKTLSRYDVEGTQLWSEQIIGRPRGTAVAPDGSIVMTASTSVERYTQDGTQLWQYFSGQTTGLAAVNDEMAVVVGSNGGTLHAIDLDDGSLIWIFTAGGDDLHSPLIDEDGMVFVGSDTGVLYALGDDNDEDGATDILWSLDLGEPMEPDAPVIITSEGSIVAITTPNHTVTDNGYTVHRVEE